MPIRPFDWVFFSSKQAVAAFFKQEKYNPALKYGAVGKGTAEALARYGEARFVGTSSHTELVAKEFAQHAGSTTVLFPCSNISERTIQQALRAEQVLEVVCYTTTEVPTPVGHPDVLVFSSPSNVRAFFEANTLLAHQQVVVFGPSTAKQVAEFTSHAVVVLKQADTNSVLEAIKAALQC